YGLIYSSKLLGSVVGIGVGASVIDAWGYAGAYWIAATSALVSAGIAVFLRQPGRRQATATQPRVAPAAEPRVATEMTLTPTSAD
ncbi:MAG TPA: MFS transporter, partial [Mycobacterium sp.]|nr:MFS transporter [Mycobacterium sp.]